MSTSTITTGQFVRINQSPASVGERIFARVIDTVLLSIYLGGLFYFLTYLNIFVSDKVLAWTAVGLLLPAVFYSPICETLCHGQTFGKYLLRMRVVKADGSSPSLGSSLLRWLLLPLELYLFGGVGALVMILNRNNQRLGDLAAGTMVVKLYDYRKVHVTLDEFRNASRYYTPVYPEAAELTDRQVEVIRRTVVDAEQVNSNRVEKLAEKIRQLLHIDNRGMDDEKFLSTLYYDYHYYAFSL